MVNNSSNKEEVDSQTSSDDVNAPVEKKVKLSSWENIVQDHFEKYNYSSLELFLASLKPYQDRTVPPLKVDFPRYCYQHGTRLNALVNGILIPAIVVMVMEDQANDDAISNIRVTHCLSLVDDKYLLDVGFAANSLRDGLCFSRTADPSEEISLCGDKYRIVKADSSFTPKYFATDSAWYRLLVQVDKGWLELFRFAPDSPLTREYLLQMNKDLFLNPIRQWIRDDVLLLAKVTPTERWQLCAYRDGSQPPTIERLGVKDAAIHCESFAQLKRLTLEIFNVHLPVEVEEAFFETSSTAKECPEQ